MNRKRCMAAGNYLQQVMVVTRFIENGSRKKIFHNFEPFVPAHMDKVKIDFRGLEDSDADRFVCFSTHTNKD